MQPADGPRAQPAMRPWGSFVCGVCGVGGGALAQPVCAGVLPEEELLRVGQLFIGGAGDLGTEFGRLEEVQKVEGVRVAAQGGGRRGREEVSGSEGAPAAPPAADAGRAGRAAARLDGWDAALSNKNDRAR